MALRHSARLLHAALALTFGLSVPLAAQEAAPAAPTTPATEAVTIPFAPPLGTPLTYALRFERKRARGDSVYDYEQRFTFARFEEGFLLRLETLAFMIGGQRLDLTDARVMEGIPAALRPYLMPMTVELDEAGEMVRIQDWEAMRASLRGLPEAAAQMSGAPLDVAGQAALAQVLGPIINASAEDAPALMIRGWPAVLGFGGIELDLGQTYEVEGGVDGGFAPEPLPAVVQVTLTRTPEGNLRLFQSTAYDPAAMEAATSAALAAMGTRVDAAETPGAMQVSDNVDIAFDPVTGMPVTAEVLRIVSVDTSKESGAGGEIMTIRRIAP